MTNDTANPALKAGTPQGLVLVTAPLFAMLGAVLIAPLLATIRAEYQDVPYANVLVPLLLTAPAFFLAVLSPAAGLLGDRIGPRKVLLWSLAIYGFAGMAPLFIQSLYGILASRLLLGIAEAGLVTGAMALLSNYFHGDDRQKWLAYQMVFLPWAGAIIMAISGAIGDFSWRLTFVMYGLAFFAFFAGLLMLFDARTETAAPANAPEATTERHLSWRLMLHICAIAVPGSIAFYVAPTQLAFLLEAQGITTPSTSANVTALGLILGPVGALMTRKLTNVSVGKVLSVGFALMGAGLITMALGPNVATVASGLVMQQIGGGMMLVTGMTYVLSLATPAERGRYSGFWWLVYTLAQFFTPLLLSGLQAATGGRVPAILIAGSVFVALCLWLMTHKALKRAVVPATAAGH